MDATEDTTSRASMSIDEWLDADDVAAVTVGDRDAVYILPYGDDLVPWICVNTRTNMVWHSDSRMLRVVFADARLHPLAVH